MTFETIRLNDTDYKLLAEGKWVIHGNVFEGKVCPTCGGTPVIYSNEYDELLCPHCNRWLREGCGDPKCFYCGRRPTEPLPSLLVEDSPDEVSFMRVTDDE